MGFYKDYKDFKKLRKIRKETSKYEGQIKIGIVEYEDKKKKHDILLEKVKKLRQEFIDLKKEKSMFTRMYRWFVLFFSSGAKFLIHMEHDNGVVYNFVIRAKDFFIYQEGRYVIDDKLKRFNATANMFELYYHAGISIPFKFEIDKKEINELLMSNKAVNISTVDPSLQDIPYKTSLNPRTLDVFITSKFVEKVMLGADATSSFSTIIIILSVLGLIVLIMLFLIIRISGAVG